jgi:hypothetical protein
MFSFYNYQVIACKLRGRIISQLEKACQRINPKKETIAAPGMQS